MLVIAGSGRVAVDLPTLTVGSMSLVVAIGKGFSVQESRLSWCHPCLNRRAGVLKPLKIVMMTVSACTVIARGHFFGETFKQARVLNRIHESSYHQIRLSLRKRQSNFRKDPEWDRAII